MFRNVRICYFLVVSHVENLSAGILLDMELHLVMWPNYVFLHVSNLYEKRNIKIHLGSAQCVIQCIFRCKASVTNGTSGTTLDIWNVSNKETMLSIKNTLHFFHLLYKKIIRPWKVETIVEKYMKYVLLAIMTTTSAYLQLFCTRQHSISERRETLSWKKFVLLLLYHLQLHFCHS